MRLRYPLFFFFLLSFSVINSQSDSKNVLFTIDNEPVYTSEFIRVYKKNLDLVQDESQKNIDEYLTLFTNYKLKLKEARNLGLQNKPSYLKELESYKKQLAKNFLTDSKVTDALIEEAYERVSNEVKANHILVRLAENANPQDTLVAYKKIQDLRDRALNEGFEKVMKKVHNGQTLFGEELGYFSGFKMVYAFENAAFNTNIGEISQPFRTRFGYHIVKVYDKRKSRGKRTVAHIMVNSKKGDSLAERAKNRINDIFTKLNQGEDFKGLAKQFSEDKSSASKGGMLAPFSAGQLSSQIFEDTAFGLENIGDISKPIKTDYGWHILKLYGKQPVKPFQDLRPELEMKVKRDERSRLIDAALVNKLKKQYNISENQPPLDYFTSILNDNYFKRSWKLPEDFKGEEVLVNIGDKQIFFKDFGDYLVKSQRSFQGRAPFDKVVENSYESFLSASLMAYKEEHLEEENKDYAHIVKEYRDGLLLFDLMETTIWNVSRTDTLGLKQFYEVNKSSYMWPDRVDAIVASSTNESVIKKVSKFLKKFTSVEKIEGMMNKDDEVNVIFTTGLMYVENQVLPENFELKEGVSEIYKQDDSYIVVKVKGIYHSKQKLLEEAKGQVVSDFQAYKEKEWLEELQNKYKISINNEALNEVKSIINQ
jgi:peptidyl-prolyl cis-trans isomerase SurA